MSTSKTYRAILVGTGGIADAHVRAAEASHGRVVITAAAELPLDDRALAGTLGPARRCTHECL